MFKSVLFVCVGNICRSPLAEGLMKHLAETKGIEVKVGSAGIHALVGRAPEQYSQEIAKENGFDISNYQAVQITEKIVFDYELILTLDSMVYDEVVKRYPFVIGKVKKLGFLQDHQDVADPYLKDRSAFDEMYIHIKQCINNFISRFYP